MNVSRTMHTLHTLTITLAVVTLAGCSSSNIQEAEPVSATPPPRLETKLLTDTTWQAESILGKAASAADSTLTFTSDGISGNAGCNQYQGGAELGKGTLQVGPLATTRKMCAPPVSGQETVFLAALEMARGWEWTGNTLELLDDANAVVLRFKQP